MLQSKKDKCYFVQSSYYIPANMTENSLALSCGKKESNCFLENLDEPMNNVLGGLFY